MSKPPRWKASQSNELKKLNSSSDWSFASSPLVGKKRAVNADETPNKKRAAGVPDEVAPDTPSDGAAEDDTTAGCISVLTSCSTPSSTSKAASKPESTRVILDVSVLKRVLEDYIRCCPKCESPMTVSFPSVCIASSIRIECSNKLCTFVDVRKPSSMASVPLPDDASALKKRNTDYAVNVLYLLGFLSSGDGGKEAEKLLGFLGLPNATTMEKRSWPNMERTISDTVQSVTSDVLDEHIYMAVEKYFESLDNGAELFALWVEQCKPENAGVEVLPKEDYPKLKVGADMGWQGRSSGVQYNSLSGHALLIEQELRLAIAMAIKSKLCNICHWNDDNAGPPREHKCTKNHEGSSGSMEPQAILEMVVELYDSKYVLVDVIVTDDDSSIKAKCKWSNADHMINNDTDVAPVHVTAGGNIIKRPDKGELPARIPKEPTFLADPNHRKKTLKGALYAIMKRRVNDRNGLSRVDIMRVTNNFAYMIRTLHHLDGPEDYIGAGQAVLEHHFDNHEHCRDWCLRKDQTQAERDASGKIYRCKTRDAKLYAFLKQLLARFVSKEALMEVAHDMDTQVNESLNNTIAWMAPKNKTYCGSQSLRNRVCMAVGISSLGTSEYFGRLFEALGIEIPPDIKHYLKLHGQTREYRITKAQEPASKRIRNKKYHDKLKVYTEELRNKLGIYQPGIGLDGGYQQPAAAQPARSTAVRKCSACGAPGHNRSNKSCPLYKKKTTAAAPTAPTMENRDAVEQDLMDQLAFAPDDDEDVDSSALEVQTGFI